MTVTPYQRELNSALKVDERLAQHLHNVAHHPDIPDVTAARLYAIKLGRWRAGQRDFPCPPSVALGVDGVQAVYEIVARYVAFAKSYGAPARPTEDARALAEVSEWLSEDDEQAGRHAA